MAEKPFVSPRRLKRFFTGLLGEKLNTKEEILANTDEKKFAGAMAVQEMYGELNDSLGEDENGMTLHEKLDYIMENGGTGGTGGSIKLLSFFNGDKTNPPNIGIAHLNTDYLIQNNNFKYTIKKAFKTQIVIGGGITNRFGFKINDVVIKDETIQNYHGVVIHDYDFSVGDTIEFTWYSGHGEVGFAIKL